MPDNISRRIALLRFPLIVAIVFIHMHTDEIDFDSSVTGEIFNAIVYYISRVLAEVAVPLFFAISGYLFFYNFICCRSFFIKKYRSRMRTLLLPYLLWNLIVFLFYAIAQSLPVTAHYFSGERPIVLTLSGSEYVQLFLGVGAFEYPVAFQFWFIRDLIVMVLLSPVIYLFLRYIPYLFLTLTAALWIFSLFQPNIFHTQFVALFFFTLGTYLGLRKYDFSLSDRYLKQLAVLYLVMSITMIYYRNPVFENVTILLGTVTFFAAAGYLATHHTRIAERMAALGKYSFFLFALHEPLLSIVRKISFSFLQPQSNFTIFILYLLIPVMTIVVSIYIYKLMQRYIPGTLQLLTGDRV